MGRAREWVTKLPDREQGALLVGLRGCDLTPKYPIDSSERQLVAYLRYVVLNPADEREVTDYGNGGFMQRNPPLTWTAAEFGHYPLHWYTHLMHAFEIVAYRCTAGDHAEEALAIYLEMVQTLHLEPESKETMIRRLSEDRIAAPHV